jgi:hypothetical protein
MSGFQTEEYKRILVAKKINTSRILYFRSEYWERTNFERTLIAGINELLLIMKHHNDL